MKKSLVTLQFDDVDLTSRGTVEHVVQAILPQIVELILTTVASRGDRGCSVGGSVSAGPGGVSGSVTLTCTL